jgi:hypothetical protein
VSRPIAPATGVAFAFPDVCFTPAPPGPPVPIPYPNIAQLDSATDVSTGSGGDLLVGGMPVLLKGSSVNSTTGDQAGSQGGVKDLGKVGGPCTVVQASGSVLYGGKGITRFGDQTEQNGSNAVGTILSANPTVLVGD